MAASSNNDSKSKLRVRVKGPRLVGNDTQNSRFNYDQIGKAVNALYEYLERKKTESIDSGTNLLWEEVRDLNLLIEPKLKPRKAKHFRSFRIPVVHSWRNDGNHDICIITRTKDVALWEDILLTKFPVAGVKRIIGLTEFRSSFESEKARKDLCTLFDLFIVHPLIVHFVTSKLVVFLKKQNKFS